jgi:hypothetical protein
MARDEHPDMVGVRPNVTGVDHRAEAADLRGRIAAALALLDDWREHAQPFRYRELVDALTGKADRQPGTRMPPERSST